MQTSSPNNLSVGNTKYEVQPSFDFHIESLRGIAALLVVLSHVLTNEFHLDPSYKLVGIWLYSTPGHVSVLIFFILSGYVIGLTNKVPIRNRHQQYQYLKKRFVRLYPLYLIAIVFAIVVANYLHYIISLLSIGWHLVFGQVLFTEVLYTNQPLWSLSYEVAYYLLFLLISYYQWPPLLMIVVFFVCGVVNRFLPNVAPVLTSYCFGACFWLLGLFISRLPRNSKPIQFGALLAFIVLLFCYDRIDIFYRTLIHASININEQEIHSFFKRAVTFADFALLLFCIPLLLRFTNRQFPGAVLLEYTAFFSPAFYLVGQLIIKKGYNPSFFKPLVIFIIFYIISFFIYFSKNNWNKEGEYLLSKLVPLGSISYGIYIIHFPILMLFQHTTVVSGSSITFILRLFIYIAIVLLAGWFLEHKVQKWFKSKLT